MNFINPQFNVITARSRDSSTGESGYEGEPRRDYLDGHAGQGVNTAADGLKDVQYEDYLGKIGVKLDSVSHERQHNQFCFDY